MVQSSSIREKLRSGSLKQLALERGIRKSKKTQESIPVARTKKVENGNHTESDSEDDARRIQDLKAKSCNSLLSILPEPKNGSAFGPTVDLKKLLRMPERAVDSSVDGNSQTIDPARTTEDGMLEFDVSKVVSDPIITTTPSFEDQRTKIVVPKGKEKQKNQITYLAQLGKANELERKEQAAIGRLNKLQARAKYGW